MASPDFSVNDLSVPQYEASNGTRFEAGMRSPPQALVVISINAQRVWLLRVDSVGND
jgi:hypothetical protein